MKNIVKKLFTIVAVFIAASFASNAQTNNASIKTDAGTQTAQQVPAAEKFFNIQSLDDLKTRVEVAYAIYKQATPEKSQELQLEYLKAKRLYIVELEKTMPSFDKNTDAGQKIRAELRKANTTE